MSRFLYLPTAEFHIRRWRVEEKPNRRHYGFVDFDNKKICIDTGMSVAEKLSSLRHEVVHIVRGYDEDVVTAFEDAMLAVDLFAQKKWKLQDDES